MLATGARLRHIKQTPDLLVAEDARQRAPLAGPGDAGRRIVGAQAFASRKA
jgi:hypothetical protein